MSSSKFPWRRKLKAQPCVYCGKPGGHPDHVPPRTMYFGEPDNLITVPACVRCNNGESDFDHLFRIVVAARFKPTNCFEREWLRDAARAAVDDGRVRRVIEATHYRIAGTNIRWSEVPTDGFLPVCERIVRGLYWWEFGEVLPLELKVTAGATDDYPSEDSPIASLWQIREVAGGQFRYAFIRDPVGLVNSLWFMEFQNQAKAVVATGDLAASGTDDPTES